MGGVQIVDSVTLNTADILAVSHSAPAPVNNTFVRDTITVRGRLINNETAQDAPPTFPSAPPPPAPSSNPSKWQRIINEAYAALWAGAAPLLNPLTSDPSDLSAAASAATNSSSTFNATASSPPRLPPPLPPAPGAHVPVSSAIYSLVAVRPFAPVLLQFYPSTTTPPPNSEVDEARPEVAVHDPTPPPPIPLHPIVLPPKTGFASLPTASNGLDSASSLAPAPSIPLTPPRLPLTHAPYTPSDVPPHTPLHPPQLPIGVPGLSPPLPLLSASAAPVRFDPNQTIPIPFNTTVVGTQYNQTTQRV